MASLLELTARADELGLGLDILSLHGRGKETDIDNLTGLHLGDGTHLVTTAREALGPDLVLVANPGLQPQK